jgi:hypothetical protein
MPHKTVHGPLTSGMLAGSSSAAASTSTSTSGTSAGCSLAVSLVPQADRISPAINKITNKKYFRRMIILFLLLYDLTKLLSVQTLLHKQE